MLDLSKYEGLREKRCMFAIREESQVGAAVGTAAGTAPMSLPASMTCRGASEKRTRRPLPIDPCGACRDIGSCGQHGFCVRERFGLPLDTPGPNLWRTLPVSHKIIDALKPPPLSTFAKHRLNQARRKDEAYAALREAADAAGLPVGEFRRVRRAQRDAGTT